MTARGRETNLALNALLAAVIAAPLALAAIVMPRPAFAAPPAGAPDGAPPAVSALAHAPHLQAATFVLIEPSGDMRLAGRGADIARPMASTTKLMTALLVLELDPLARVLTAPAYAAGPAESVMGLQAGERMSVADLLTGMLLPSANDAADALAIRTAGTSAAFVSRMNRRAGTLGLGHTHYGSPVGLDDGETYSSAADLARLAAVDLRTAFFRRTVARRAALVGIGQRRRTVVNRNTLLGRAPWINGVKTGHTSAAGDVLVGSGTVSGVTLISVVMGEPDEAARDSDSLALLRFGFRRVHRVQVVRGGTIYARRAVEGASRPADLEAATELAAVAIRGVPIERRVLAPARLRGPLSAGAPVGVVVVRSGGRELGRVALRVRGVVPAPAGMSGTLSDVLKATGAGLGSVALGIGTILLVRRRRQSGGQEARPRPARRLA